MIKRSNNFDVAVIGGGPAGMIAAGRAAELGARVVLVEKNKLLGNKLLITGKGRCNITNAEFDNRKFSENFGKKGNFLLSPFSIFGVKETISFFEKRGLKIKTEHGKRVFPESDRSKSVLNILLNYLKEGKVTIMKNAEVISIRKSDERNIGKILLKDGRSVLANNYIICTGGKAYPELGSTGSGYLWANKLGHTIEKLKPALVPLRVKEKWVKELKGLSLKNIKMEVYQDNVKKTDRFGELLFTHFGLSGPIVLDASREIGDLLEEGKVKISLDLKPALNILVLEKRLQRDFEKFKKMIFKNYLSNLVPKKIIPIIMKFSGIKQRRMVCEIGKEERIKLANVLKGLEIYIDGLLNFDKAIITSGGISLKEIDSKFMKSKMIDNLFFAGEIIDIFGPSGGYNLQICWTTGYIAGQNAFRKAKSNM